MYKKLFLIFLTLTSVHTLWSQGDETLFNRFGNYLPLNNFPQKAQIFADKLIRFLRKSA